MILVLDSSAMLAYLRAELGGEIVRDLLADATNTLFAHGINLCEVFYDFHRAASEAAARSIIDGLLATALQPREDMDRAFWEQAGRHKSVYRRVSLADCCALALAQRVNGELVTTDHHEFDPIAAAGICPIRFIR